MVGGNGWVHFLNCCDMYTNVQTYQIVHLKYMQFLVWELYFNIAVKKKK